MAPLEIKPHYRATRLVAAADEPMEKKVRLLDLVVAGSRSKDVVE